MRREGGREGEGEREREGGREGERERYIYVHLAVDPVHTHKRSLEVSIGSARRWAHRPPS
jgi:hypothetical protein